MAKRITSLFLLISWIALYAQQRFYDKSIKLEARATQTDIENIHELQIKTIMDEFGRLVELMVFENNELDHEALEEEMYLWRVRDKYWGRQEAMEYLHSVTKRTI